MNFRASSLGFSIAEVMVAMALLAIGVTAMLSGIVSQQQGRSGVRDTQRVTNLSSSLKERLLSEPWTQTATIPVRGLGVATWCTPGVFNQTTPFTGTGVHNETELIATGIITQPSGLTNLCYYVEYYRADTLTATQHGLLDKGVDADGDNVFDRFTSEAESRAGVIANLATAQRFAVAPTTSIGLDEPLAIRLILVWRGTSVFGAQLIGADAPGVQHLDLILARGAN